MTLEARLHGAELHGDSTVRLRLPGTDTVRDLRPRIDDVADRKHVFVHPALTAGGSSARPCCTVDNDLVIEVTPAESPICPR